MGKLLVQCLEELSRVGMGLFIQEDHEDARYWLVYIMTLEDEEMGSFRSPIVASDSEFAAMLADEMERIGSAILDDVGDLSEEDLIDEARLEKGSWWHDEVQLF